MKRQRRRPPIHGTLEERLEYTRARRGEGATVAEVAAELRITERWLYQMLAEGRRHELLAS